jgi:hypothetical protein
MRLPAEAIALEPGTLDQEHPAARPAQDALLVVVEVHVAHGEIIALDPNAGAVVVADRDAGALDALDQHIVRSDHEGRLAFDRVASEVRARLAAQNETRRRDDCAFLVKAGRQDDVVARHGRRQRVLQAGVPAIGLRRTGWTYPQRARLNPICIASGLDRFGAG